jgi:hypothetical protein
MSNSTSVTVTVDLHVFPLYIVQEALYSLGDRIDGRIQTPQNGGVQLALYALADDLTAMEMEQALNAALLATSANERAFQGAMTIRNLLAQTAFSITTENQQTLEEFVADLGTQQESEHAGAPARHLNVQMADDQVELTADGNRLTVDEENSRVLLWLDPRRYLLPDALWAAHEMRAVCQCRINNSGRGQLFVVLEPKDGNIGLDVLGERFQAWLDIAASRPLG